MNPIEKVWKGIRKRCCKNKAFQTLESVIDKLQEVIQGLEKKRFENHRVLMTLREERPLFFCAVETV